MKRLQQYPEISEKRHGETQKRLREEFRERAVFIFKILWSSICFVIWKEVKGGWSQKKTSKNRKTQTRKRKREEAAENGENVSYNFEKTDRKINERQKDSETRRMRVGEKEVSGSENMDDDKGEKKKREQARCKILETGWKWNMTKDWDRRWNMGRYHKTF